MPVVVHQTFVETTGMQRIDHNVSRKSYEITAIKAIGLGRVIEMLIQSIFLSSLSSFLTSVVFFGLIFLCLASFLVLHFLILRLFLFLCVKQLDVFDP